MFDWNTGEAGYAVSIFPDDTPAIDFVLDGVVVKKIYEAWDERVDGELVDYGGGTRAITVKMLVSAGEEFLLGIKNIGAVRSSGILSEAQKALEEVPYGSGL